MNSAEYVNRYAKMLHLIMFDHNDDQRIKQFFNNNSELKHINNISVLKNSKKDLYCNYDSNHHHWTTKRVWEYAVPVLAEKLDLNIDFKAFDKMIYIRDGQDLSFHRIKNENEFLFDVYRLDDLQTCVKSGSNMDAVRCLDDKTVKTNYQTLFTIWHGSGIIKNRSVKNCRKLLYNGDSQSIPIIPILAYYFEEIMFLDNRTDMSYRSTIDEFKFTDYVCLIWCGHVYEGFNKMLENMK